MPQAVKYRKACLRERVTSGWTRDFMTITRISLIALGLMILVMGGAFCSGSNDAGATAVLKADGPPIPGAERTEEYVEGLRGKRIGMVVNQTSTIGGRLSV